MSKKELDILDDEELELDEKCSCSDEAEECNCEDDEAELEENFEKSESSKYPDDAEEEDMAESLDIDFSKLAESLGLKESTSVSALKDKVEAVISLKTEEARSEIETSLKKEAVEAVKTIKEEIEADLVEKMNAYVSIVVKDWVSENKVEITNAIELDRAKRVVEGMKKVLEENSIELDEDTREVVSELNTRIHELEETNRELSEINSKYRSLLEEVAKEQEIRKYDLTESQVEKVKKISADFEVNEALEGRIEAVVSLIKESTRSTPTAKQQPKDLTESFSESFVKPEKIVNESTESKTFESFLSEIINN